MTDNFSANMRISSLAEPAGVSVEIQARAQRKLDEVSAKLRELEGVRTTLVGILRHCETHGSPTCYPMIDTLDGMATR